MPLGEWIGGKLKATFASGMQVLDYVVTKCKPAARFIGNSWPISSLYKGASSVQYIPDTLKHNPKVAAIVEKSFYTNFFNYLVPTVVLFRLGSHVLPRYMPGTFSSEHVPGSVQDPNDFTYIDYASNMLYYAPLYLTVGRIFVRNLVKNISHQATMSREMINGKRDRSKAVLAAQLTDKIWRPDEDVIEIKDEKGVTTKKVVPVSGTGLRELWFKEKFRFNPSEAKLSEFKDEKEKESYIREKQAEYTERERNAYVRFQKAIQVPVDQLFNQEKIEEKELERFSLDLQKVIYDTIVQHTELENKEQQKAYSNALSRAIVNEYKLRTGSEFKAVSRKAGYEKAVLSLAPKRLSKQRNMEAFEKVVDLSREDSKHYFQAALQQKGLGLSSNPIGHIEGSLSAVAKAFHEAQDHLPIKYIDPCPCSVSKQAQAEVSSGFYYAFNMILLGAASYLTGRFNPQDAFYVSYVIEFSRGLLYGISMLEYKVAADFQCTRHRFAKVNYTAAFGAGALHMAVSRMIELAVERLTGVRNFFSDDAIENFIMQLLTIGVIADPRPLPEANKWIPDFFFPGRWLARGFITLTQYLAVSNDADNASRESAFKSIKELLMSREMRFAARVIFSGNQLLPAPGTAKELRELLGMRYDELIGPFRSAEDLDRLREFQLIKFTEATKNKLEELFIDMETVSAKPDSQPSSAIVRQCIEQRHQLIAEEKAANARAAVMSLTQDTLLMVLKFQAIEDLLKVFRKDIGMGLNAVETAKGVIASVTPLTSWIPSPLLWLPIPNSVASYVHMVLLILHDESFGALYARLQHTIMILEYSKSINESKVTVVIDPQRLARNALPIPAAAQDLKATASPNSRDVEVVLPSRNINFEQVIASGHFGVVERQRDEKGGAQSAPVGPIIILDEDHFARFPPAATSGSTASAAASSAQTSSELKKKKSSWFPSISFFSISGFSRACSAGNGAQPLEQLPAKKFN